MYVTVRCYVMLIAIHPKVLLHYKRAQRDFGQCSPQRDVSEGLNYKIIYILKFEIFGFGFFYSYQT